MYYSNKLDSLKDIFGRSKNIQLKLNCLIVDDYSYPIIDDVIILLDPSQYPHSVRKSLGIKAKSPVTQVQNFAEDIQFTFGDEWVKFPKILPEHEQEFSLYFDIVDLPVLLDQRVCDLGCGIGRWSHFLKDKCRELVLVDFSEAIFVARKNLADTDHALFFMGDIKRLPFRESFSDFLFCLGVLHHLPTNALEEVRALKKLAPKLLIYLYYALDNRPFYFRILLAMMDPIRRLVSKIRNESFRSSFSWLFTVLVYMPFVITGKILKPFNLSSNIPLYEVYNGKSLSRIRQDVFDRFFTRIEQRVSKDQIMTLENDPFNRVRISQGLPYWHFLCETDDNE